MRNQRMMFAGCGALLAVCLCLSAAVAGVYVARRLAPAGAQPATPVELSGHLVIGFEIASFVPCDQGGDPGDSQGYWLSADPGVELYDAYHSATGDDYVPAFIHFTGRLSPAGEYGHMGGYTHEVTVTEIIALNTTGVCP